MFWYVYDLYLFWKEKMRTWGRGGNEICTHTQTNDVYVKTSTCISHWDRNNFSHVIYQVSVKSPPHSFPHNVYWWGETHIAHFTLFIQSSLKFQKGTFHRLKSIHICDAGLHHVTVKLQGHFPVLVGGGQVKHTWVVGTRTLNGDIFWGPLLKTGHDSVKQGSFRHRHLWSLFLF